MSFDEVAVGNLADIDWHGLLLSVGEAATILLAYEECFITRVLSRIQNFSGVGHWIMVGLGFIRPLPNSFCIPLRKL